MRTQRLEKIENFVYHYQAVTLDQLCDAFKVSKNTIRRDIDEIVKGKKIEKTYGGVRVAKEGITLPSFGDRPVQNLDLKNRIARTACDYVKDGDIIFIDSGTTTCHMIEGLQNKQVTVLTNNLEFLIQAVPYTGLQVFSLSGELDRSTLSFTGPHTLEVLKSYNISKAFMAATGISTDAEVSNTVPAESVVKKLAIARSQEVYLLLDSSKFNQTSMVTYSSFSNFDALITDKQPTGDLLISLQKNDVEIVLADCIGTPASRIVP